MDSDSVKVRKNIPLIHPAFAPLTAEIQIGKPVIRGNMRPVQLSAYVGAGFVEMGNGTSDDLIADLCHGLGQPFRKSADHTAHGAGRQGDSEHTAKNLPDAIGTDSTYGVESDNKPLKLFAVLNRPFDIFRKHTAKLFSRKRAGNGKRFMRGDADLYGSVRHFARFCNAGFAPAFLVMWAGNTCRRHMGYRLFWLLFDVEMMPFVTVLSPGFASAGFP